MLNFIAGGHETTGSTIMWVAHVLATRSDVQDRLKEEIASLFKGKPQDWQPSYEEIEHLSYVNNFLREILRCYSPGMTFSPAAPTTQADQSSHLPPPRGGRRRNRMRGVRPRGDASHALPGGRALQPTRLGPRRGDVRPRPVVRRTRRQGLVRDGGVHAGADGVHREEHGAAERQGRDRRLGAELPVLAAAGLERRDGAGEPELHAAAEGGTESCRREGA